jgi:hypothetical protein
MKLELLNGPGSNAATIPAWRPKSSAGSAMEVVVVPERGSVGLMPRFLHTIGRGTLQNRSRMVNSSYVTVRKQVLLFERKQNP